MSVLCLITHVGLIFSGEPVSTRAGISLIKAAKAWAYLDRRDFLKPEDIQMLLLPVLGHRLGGTHGLRQGREWARPHATR